VSLERRLPGRAWRALTTVETDPYGVFTAELDLPGAAELRFAYSIPQPNDGRTRTTASTPVTVRRSVGVVAPR
jgi:hypothetical protein